MNSILSPTVGSLPALFCALVISSFEAPTAMAYAVPTVPTGAVCDGSTDDSTAFQNALTTAEASGGVIEIPAGTCIVNSSLVITPSSNNYVSIVGQGQKISWLSTTSDSITQIVVNGNNVALKHFGLTRTTTATAGADGISTYNSSSEPAIGYTGLYIDDVRVLYAHTGFDLYQGNGYVTNSWAAGCQGAGFRPCGRI